MAKQSIDPFRKVKSPFKPRQSVGTPTQVAGGGLKFVDPKVAIARAAESQGRRDLATGGAPTTFKSGSTGRISGVTAGGKTFLDLSPSEAEQLIEGKDETLDTRSLGTGGGASTDISEANKLKAIAEAQAQLEEEQFPEVRQLDPQDRAGSQLPVIGGIATPITNLILQEMSKTKLGRSLIKQPLTPDQLRTAELTEIERRVFQEGVTASEGFGTLIESIHIIGGLVSKYANGLIETPSGNIRTIERTIKTERRRATRMATNARTGVLSPEKAREQIDGIERNIQALESRIKLLINFSPQLRFNSDQINKIEVDILSARDILLEAKIDISRGLITEPDEMQIYLAMQKERLEEVEE